MSAQYGGDEIGALILDPGSHTIRAGFAGEDTPKCIIPAAYGISTLKSSDRYYGDAKIHQPRPNLEIKSYMNNGLIEDFDAASHCWSHIFDHGLRVKTSEQPLMITEPAWNQSALREKSLEIAFEKLHVPASYLLKSAVAAAFAAGKSTALVVDVGHSVASVTPVYDGLVLKRGMQKQEYAGEALNEAVNQVFKARNIEIPPHFSVRSKGSAEDGKGAVLNMPEGLADSFLTAERTRVVEEFKETVLQVYEAQYNDSQVEQRPARIFEFPTGHQVPFKAERFKISEALFSSDDTHTSIQGMIKTALESTDVDTRPLLLQNVIVTGGSTLIPGFEARLQHEILQLFPGAKLRIHGAGNTVERKCAGWLGGSILGSLGTFHQLWISKSEWEEHGPSRIEFLEKRCK